MSRIRWFWLVSLLLAIPVVAVAAPEVYDRAWGDGVEARLCALEELNGISDPSCSDPPANLTVSQDTVWTEPLVHDGGTITFTNGARLECGAGCYADLDGVTLMGQGDFRFVDQTQPSFLRNMVVDLQPLFELGRYPLHWHLNGDGTRGTIVENVTVRNSTNNAFVPHGSNGISFLNVRAENIIGHAFWWDFPGTNRITCAPEDPKRLCVDDNSNDTLIDGAVAENIQWSRDIDPCCSKWNRISAFVLGAGSGNIIRNSSVNGVVGGGDCSGFFWPEHVNNNIGGTVWTFENNSVLDDNCHGIFVWQNDDPIHVVDGFTGEGIEHGAYKNAYHYQNVNVPYLRIHALGWSMSDSHAGATLVVPHNNSAAGEAITFTNVTFDSFEVKNGSVPGIYHLNQTNLTCADIIWTSKAVGTQLFIDGVEC